MIEISLPPSFNSPLLVLYQDYCHTREIPTNRVKEDPHLEQKNLINYRGKKKDILIKLTLEFLMSGTSVVLLFIISSNPNIFIAAHANFTSSLSGLSPIN